MIKIKRLISVIFALSLTAAAPSSAMLVAHRGASALAPENTAAAFTAAAVRGADAIECDLRLTADGVLVCHHDESTGRVWDADLKISESTLSSLKELELSRGFAAAFPSHLGAEIPTFAEGVAAMGEAHIFAEVKDEGEQILERLTEECEALGIKGRLTVISYHREAVEYMHGKGYDCALLTHSSSWSELSSLDLPEGIALDVNKEGLSSRTVERLHAQGRRVYCYTADDKREFGRLALLGVDAVTSDSL